MFKIQCFLYEKIPIIHMKNAVQQEPNNSIVESHYKNSVCG
jgi:hypothetical protein